MSVDYSKAIVLNGSFTWAEYALLREWNAYAIPTEAQEKSAIDLFTKLQPLRQALGKPLLITSGARTIQYTNFLRAKGIPAARQSAHIDWAGVDIKCPSMTNEALWRFLDARWLGRMENLKATPTWCHLDTREWGKRIRFNP